METSVRSARSAKRPRRKPAKTDNGARIDPPLEQVYWLFELEDDGTVIYSRPAVLKAEGTRTVAMEGQNFFEEPLGFEDIARYRQNFQSFIKSNRAAATFTWRCSAAGGSRDARVQMTRAYQTGTFPPTGVVMVEIRG